MHPVEKQAGTKQKQTNNNNNNLQEKQTTKNKTRLPTNKQICYWKQETKNLQSN